MSDDKYGKEWDGLMANHILERAAVQREAYETLIQEIDETKDCTMDNVKSIINSRLEILTKITKGVYDKREVEADE